MNNLYISDFYISDFYKIIVEDWSPYYNSQNELIYSIQYFWDEKDIFHFTWKPTPFHPKEWKTIKLYHSKNITSVELRERMNISYRDAGWLTVKINNILSEKNE